MVISAGLRRGGFFWKITIVCSYSSALGAALHNITPGRIPSFLSHQSYFILAGVKKPNCPRLLFKLHGLVWLGLLLAGCAHNEPKLAQPSQVAIYGSERFSSTVYLGSDKEYHYFAWTHELKRGSWKIPRYAMELPGEFPRGKGRSFVKHDAQANLVLFGFKPAREKKPAH